MINVLSTGELPDSLVTYARQQNINMDVMPFIHTEQTSNPTIIKQVQELGEGKQTVIFTSKRAVHAVSSLLPSVPDWTFYSIDGTTYQEISNRWGSQSIIDCASYGAELVQKIISNSPSEKLIFFCGDIRLDTIPDALRKAGIAFEEVVVYHTTLTPRKITNNYDAILFYSPSGVHSFFTHNQVANIRLYSIGTTTTAALENYNHGNNTIITSPKTDKKVMIEQVINSLIN